MILHFAGYRANNLLNLRMKKCNKRACLKTFYSPPYKNNHSPIRCNKPQSTQFPTHHRKSHRRHQSTIETSQVPNSLYTSGSLNMSAAPTKIYSSEPISWCDEHAGILVFLGVFVAILLVVAVLTAKQFIKDKKERRRQNNLERQDLRGNAVALGGKEGQSESNAPRENEFASGGKEVGHTWVNLGSKDRY
jgi:hypothetical protein